MSPLQYATHACYELRTTFAPRARLVIVRRDNDGRNRTVAFVDSADEWDRFTVAIDAGLGEVAAVHAIDAEAVPS